MNFYNPRTRPKRRLVLSLTFLIAIISLGVAFATHAQLQEIQALRIINVATEANTTILGAASNHHLSGNGTP